MSEVTTIPVYRETREKLKHFGLKGETYDKILNRLIASVEYEEFMEMQYERLKEKHKFISLDEL